jgi:hypothetical protein
MAKSKKTFVVPIERIASAIYLIRGEKVMLDSDLAELYGVETRVLVQAVKRNIERFPDDFCFQLNNEEFQRLISQTVTSNAGRGGRRKPPWGFTEHGVLRLSGVLRSKRAAKVNIAIMRTYVLMRKMLATNEELARKVSEHDRHIANLYEHVEKLLAPSSKKKRPIGYIYPEENE